MMRHRPSQCRVIVFPESALYSPAETPRTEIDDAVAVLCKAAGANGVYVIFCARYKRDDKHKPFERLMVEDRLEDRNDKNVSHRLYVKRVKRRFDEPYTAARGRYDVDIRYLDERDQPGRFELFVNGIAQGASWKSPGKAHGWTTHTLAAVEIRAVDEIMVATQGPAGGLDYVQLNYRKPD